MVYKSYGMGTPPKQTISDRKKAALSSRRLADRFNTTEAGSSNNDFREEGTSDVVNNTTDMDLSNDSDSESENEMWYDIENNDSFEMNDEVDPWDNMGNFEKHISDSTLSYFLGDDYQDEQAGNEDITTHEINEEMDAEDGDEDEMNPREEENEVVDLGRLHDSNPIYPGCKLTPEQSRCLILAFGSRHLTSDLALSDLILLIDAHLTNPIHGSKHLLLKNIPDVEAKEYFFCKCCKSLLLESKSDVENKKMKMFACSVNGCSEKGKFYKTNVLKKEKNYFLRVPLKDQLLHKLNDPLLYALINRDSGEGVCGGEKYKSLRDEGIMSSDDISIQFNTDGANAFESSNESVWPLQVAINELPYQIRRRNIILTGLWYGEKPVVNTFLAPFVDELIDLHENGLILSNGTKVRVHCFLAPVDSVARPILQKIKQFNGDHGCSYCLNPGVTFYWEGKKEKNQKSHIYLGSNAEERTKEQHLKDAEETIRTGKFTRGVKGISILLLLPLFCIIFAFSPDYMHNICLGVLRQFLFGWLNSANSKFDWYINPGKMDILESRIMKMTPPDEITRMPRKLLYRRNFKASEFRTFLIHYSVPCLKGILPEKYLKHWVLLVYSVRIFLQPKISQEEWQSAKEAMEKFVFMTEHLYPKQWMTFNVHLLLHVPKFVKLYGGLWDHSCYMFEHFIGVVVKLFHGSQYITDQIFKNYIRIQYLQEIVAKKKIFAGCHPSVEKLLLKLCGKFFLSKISDSASGTLMPLGSYKMINLSLVEILALRSIFTIAPVSREDKRKCWDRCLVKGIKCAVSSYDRAKRKNNVVELDDGKILEIEKIISVNGQFVLIGHRIVTDVNNLYRGYLLLRNKSAMPSIVVSEEEIDFQRTTIAVLPSSVKRKCVYMKVGDSEFISRLPNPYERD